MVEGYSAHALVAGNGNRWIRVYMDGDIIQYIAAAAMAIGGWHFVERYAISTVVVVDSIFRTLCQNL